MLSVVELIAQTRNEVMLGGLACYVYSETRVKRGILSLLAVFANNAATFHT